MKRQIVIYAILCVVCVSGHVAMAGEIVGWGDNSFNLINDIPTGPGNTDFIAVTAGAYHAFALRSDGTVEGWGDNTYDQLIIPADANNIVAIAAGLEFTLALKEDGSIIAWGDNDQGQTDKPTGSNFVAIAAGRWHGLAIREDGSAIGWGYNATDINQATVPDGNDFSAIGGGAYHSVAVRGDGITGSVDVWGTSFWDLANIPLGSDFVAVDAGYFHGLALRADGTLAAWGIPNVDKGQVSDTPVDDGYVEIAAGYDFNIARKDNGTLAAWGNDTYRQITDVPLGNSFVTIAASTATGFAISEPGMLTLTSPNGGEVLNTGTMHTITWDTTGIVTNVWIEYSTDNGADWLPVGPSNEGNAGSYEWLVPVATSQECLVRVRHSPTAITAEGTDQSDAPFTIFACPLLGDVTGDCAVDLADLDVIAHGWLDSYNLADLGVIALEWLDSYTPFTE